MSEETTKDRASLAIEYHDKGYNCCQSVCCAFKDKVDLDEKTLFRITEGLGLGMGCMEGTCGAISAHIQGLPDRLQAAERNRNLPRVKGT